MTLVMPNSGPQGISMATNVADDRPQTTGTLQFRSSASHGRRRSAFEIDSPAPMAEGLGPWPRTRRRGNRREAEHQQYEGFSKFNGNTQVGLDRGLSNDKNHPTAAGLQKIPLNATVPPGQRVAVSAEGQDRHSLLAARCLLNCLSAGRHTEVTSDGARDDKNDASRIDEGCRGDTSEMTAVAAESPTGERTSAVERSSAPKQRVVFLHGRSRVSLSRQKSKRKKVPLSSVSCEGASAADNWIDDRHARNKYKRRLPWKKETTAAAERPRVTAGAVATDRDLAGNDDPYINGDDRTTVPANPPPVDAEAAASKRENEAAAAAAVAAAAATASGELKRLGAATRAIGLINDPSSLHQELGLVLLAEGLEGPTTAVPKSGPERRCGHMGVWECCGTSPECW